MISSSKFQGTKKAESIDPLIHLFEIITL